MKTVTLDIPSMKSPHCQMAVKYTVEKLPGTHSINTEAGKAEIAYDAQQISLNTLVMAIEQAGYRVSNN